MPLTAERDQLQLCGQLPKPLFVLYNQLSGFGAACDPSLTAAIRGDLEEARNYRSQQRSDQQQLLLEGDKDDEDADSQEANGGGSQDSGANAEEAKKAKGRKGAKMNQGRRDSMEQTLNM